MHINGTLFMIVLCVLIVQFNSFTLARVLQKRPVSYSVCVVVERGGFVLFWRVAVLVVSERSEVSQVTLSCRPVKCGVFSVFTRYRAR